MKHSKSLLKGTRFILILSVIAILSFNTQAVNASCAEPGNPETEFSNEAAVFSGTVVYISGVNGLWMDGVTRTLMAIGFHPVDFYDKLFPGRRIVFEVDRSWKGVETSSVMIRTGYNTGNSSGYPFEIGGYYLVYASHAYGDPEKYLLTSLCDRTLESPNNSEDIAYLNNLPTLELSYFPALIRVMDSSQIITVLLLVGFVYILSRKRKHE